MDTSELKRLDVADNLGINARIGLWIRGSPRRVPLLYLAFLTLAEAITTLWEPRLGLALHGVCLVSLILHASLFSHGREQHFLLGLSLSPLIRLLSLTLPLSKYPYVYWYMVIGLPLFLATLILIRVTGLTNQKVGISLRKLFWQILIGSTGILLGYLEYLILHPEPLISEFRIDLIIIPALILLTFTGFLEELVFRGVFQFLTVRILGRWGLFYSALVFAVLHLGYRSVLDMVFVFVIALFFGLVVQRTGSILGVTLSHGITNIVLFLILPFFVNIPSIQPETQEIKSTSTPQVRTTPIIPLYSQGKERPTATEDSPLFIPLTETPLPSLTSIETIPTSTWTTSPLHTSTPTLQTCIPPAGWVIYTVQLGDTLFSISLIVGVNVAKLQEANCLGTSTSIWVGQQIYIPYAIVITKTSTITPVPSLTSTNTPIPSPSPSNTAVFHATETSTPTDVTIPTATATPTATSTSTVTAVPTSTPTSTKTPGPSGTPTPTWTDVPIDTPVR